MTSPLGGSYCELAVDWHDALGPVACAKPADHWADVMGRRVGVCKDHQRVCPKCRSPRLIIVRENGPGVPYKYWRTAYSCGECELQFNLCWYPESTNV